MRRAVLIGALLATGLAMASPASAQQIPDNCGGNESDFRYIRDPSNPARPGDQVRFIISLANVGDRPCNITLNSPLVFRLPALDGTATGVTNVLNPLGFTFPAGFPLTKVTIPWTVTVNPGVADASTELEGNSTLYDARVPHAYRIYRSIGTDITQPALTIDKRGSIESGVAPQNVTYTFVVTNTSSTPVPMSKVRVSDDKCGNATYSTGDDGDGKLSNGESWTFTCAQLHQAPGVYTNTAYACAESDIDKRDVCSPPDTWTVTLTPPPGSPPASPPPAGPPAETAVKPANATQAPCTLSTPKGLQVRAKELTSIKATVRQVDAGTTVKITLPGGKTVSAKTNSKGVAILKVRPPKTGTARITVAECSDVQRLTVRAARKTQSRRVPRVTG